MALYRRESGVHRIPFGESDHVGPRDFHKLCGRCGMLSVLLLVRADVIPQQDPRIAHQIALPNPSPQAGFGRGRFGASSELRRPISLEVRLLGGRNREQVLVKEIRVVLGADRF
jgi:hypothetical protein